MFPHWPERFHWELLFDCCRNRLNSEETVDSSQQSSPANWNTQTNLKGKKNFDERLLENAGKSENPWVAINISNRFSVCKKQRRWIINETLGLKHLKLNGLGSVYWNSKQTLLTSFQLWAWEWESNFQFLMSLYFRRASRRKYSCRIEFNVVAVCARLKRQNDFLYAFRVFIVGGFEFMALRQNAEQAVNLRRTNKVADCGGNCW